MDIKSSVNITICGVGILILLIHIVNLLMKKHRRKDENRLLVFMAFTVLHLAAYLTFTAIKPYYTSDTYITTAYSCFYVMNNIEVFLLFIYMLTYINMSNTLKFQLSIFNISLFGIFFLLVIINLFTGWFFFAEGGEYVRGKYMVLSQGYQFVMFAIVFLTALINKRLRVREKIAFALYCLLPLVAIILQNIYKGYAIAYVSIIITVEILFFFVNVGKNIQRILSDNKGGILERIGFRTSKEYNALVAAVKAATDPNSPTYGDFTNAKICAERYLAHKLPQGMDIANVGQTGQKRIEFCNSIIQTYNDINGIENPENNNQIVNNNIIDEEFQNQLENDVNNLNKENVNENIISTSSNVIEDKNSREP